MFGQCAVPPKRGVVLTRGRKAVSVTTLFLIATSIASVAETNLPHTFSTKDDFSLRLPQGWREIPKLFLDAYSTAVPSMAPQVPKPVFFDYGFQLEKSDNWFQYPYILVKVVKTGRISDSQLKSMRKVQGAMTDSAQLMASTVEFGQTVYDPSSHILWTQATFDGDSAGVGKVRGLAAMLLTEYGSIQVMGYAKASDFEHYAPLFEAIARGTILADSIKYRPSPTDSIPIVPRIAWDRFIGKAIAGAVIGCISAGFVRRVRRRRTP